MDIHIDCVSLSNTQKLKSTFSSSNMTFILHNLFFIMLTLKILFQKSLFNTIFECPATYRRTATTLLFWYYIVESP